MRTPLQFVGEGDIKFMHEDCAKVCEKGMRISLGEKYLKECGVYRVRE